MGGVPDEIVKRQIALFWKVDPDYGRGVARHLGIAEADLAVAAE